MCIEVQSAQWCVLLYLGNACVQSCVLIYNPYVHGLAAGYLLQLFFKVVNIQWVCVPLENKHSKDSFQF